MDEQKQTNKYKDLQPSFTQRILRVLLRLKVPMYVLTALVFPILMFVFIAIECHFASKRRFREQQEMFARMRSRRAERWANMTQEEIDAEIRETQARLLEDDDDDWYEDWRRRNDQADTDARMGFYNEYYHQYHDDD